MQEHDKLWLVGVLRLTVPWGLFHCTVNLNNSSPINTQEPLTQSPDKLFNSFIQGHKLSLTQHQHWGWCDRSIPWAAEGTCWEMLGAVTDLSGLPRDRRGCTLSWELLLPWEHPLGQGGTELGRSQCRDSHTVILSWGCNRLLLWTL